MNRRLWRFAVLLCLLTFCIGLFMSACSPQEQEITAEAAYVSPYDWSKLENKEGRYYYYKNDELASRIGIDVSDHNGEINWDAVSADGIEFAFIRIGNRGYTEGALYHDSTFDYNIEQAQGVGIDCGIYFFSQAIDEDEALEEAEFVLSALNGVELEYPIVFDHEPVDDPAGRANDLSPTKMTQISNVFCERIENEGYTAMIYGNKNDIARIDFTTLAKYEIWFAEYENIIPTGEFDFTIWQYTASGSVSGIPTAVDMNIHFLEP